MRHNEVARLVAEVERTVRPDGPWAAHVPVAERNLRHLADLTGLARPDLAGATAADGGCGDGFGLYLLVLLGAERAMGFDVDARRVAVARRAVAELPPELAGRIEVSEGDATALPLEAASIDLLVSIEAVAVYLHLDRFLDESARVLRRGGAVVVAESNDAINPRLRRRTDDLWEAYERGPAPSVVHGHRIEYPYLDERADIVQEARPGIDPATARAIAEGTSGMVRSEVVAAALHHERTGVVPDRRYRRGVQPIAPAGMVVERPVDPYDLARRLRARGFRTRVRGYWGGAQGRPVVRIADRVLASTGRLAAWTAPAFRLVGVRL